MRALSSVSERDRFAAAAYQVERLAAWMVKRSEQRRAAHLSSFYHCRTVVSTIISQRRP